MKSATAAALVALPFALAAPLQQQQHAERALVVDWVTDLEIFTVFAEVTQYATGPAPPASATVTVPAPASSAADVHKQDHQWTWSGQQGEGHGHWSHGGAPAPPTSTYVAPVPTTTSQAPVVVVPTTSSTSSTSIETPTTTSTWVYVAPTTTETPTTTAAPTTYVAPTTYAAPSPYSAPAQYVNTGVGPYSIPMATTTLSADVSAKTGDAGYATDKGAMQAALLNSTNVWRAMFQAAPLTWDYDLEAKAYNNAQGCQFEHDSAGQNLAAGYSGPESANDGWAGEYTSYNWADPDFSEAAGHFTQVVWQDTTSIGCAAVQCGSNKPAQGWYLVCNYLPVGNMLGEFAQNVKPKTS